jgi:hypothetical protein
LTGQCKFDGNLFCFFPARQDEETPPTLHTLPKPHEPTLQPKLCQRVQSSDAQLLVDKFFLKLTENQLNCHIFDENSQR